MAVYKLKNSEMPWGDYGSILLSGMTCHLERENNYLQMERTGPFCPPITVSGIWDIIVTDDFKKQLEVSGLSGLSFREVIKAKIVHLEWEKWDRNHDEPEFYPESGDPEDYILDLPHSANVAEQMGTLWEVYTCDVQSTAPDWVSVDGILYVSEATKEWLEKNASDWIKCVEALGKK